MKNHKHMVLFLILITSRFYCQAIWEDYGLSDHSYQIAHRLSIDSLQSIILSHGDNTKEVKAYEASAEYLYYMHKESQREFLLENLNTPIDTSISFPYSIFLWGKVYTDAYIRGLLGDETAIARMDTVAKYGSYYKRPMAIRDLINAGIYKDEYYNYIKEQYGTRKHLLHILAMYGMNSSYRDDVKTILEDSLRTTDPANTWGVIELTIFMGYFDQQLELETLEEYFYTTEGRTRFDYYSQLNQMFKEGQLERSKYGLLNEEDDNLRSEYLPSCYGIKVGWDSEKYLEPENLNFLLTLNNIEAGTRVYKELNYFLEEFEPAEPDSEASNGEMLERLDSLVESSYGYDWLRDEQYKDELKGILGNAESYLSSSDLQSAANEIKQFQMSVEEVHADSAGSYPRYVSDVGYKFLYYYPQYILDRLPEVTEVENDLTAIASVEVTQTGDEFVYTYTVTNETGSNQSIANIYVKDYGESELLAPEGWLAERVDSVLDRFYTVDAEEQIEAGGSKSGYTITTSLHPVMGSVYIQSERFEIDTADIMTNSYQALTVVPSSLTEEPDAAALIDSMISFNDRAYELGWIEHDWVRSNNYAQLNNARTMINVPASVIIILTAFENTLETYYGLSYFNEQTYAMLKYNSVYLREILNGQ